VIKDEDGKAKGVMGSLELLNARIVSSQPVVGFDWHADKEGLACAVTLDQQVRVLIVTKLEKY
jgi:WD repeat-containing protein 92